MAQRRDAAAAVPPRNAASFTADADVAVASRRSLRMRRNRMLRAGKPSWGGLLVRALPIALLVSACSIGSDDAGVVPVTIRSLPPLDVEAELAAQQSNPGARAELSAALMATGDSYEYETTVMIGRSVMMLVTGEVVGSAEESRVARGESVVEYLRTDDGHWVLTSGDQRVPVDRITAGTAPLGGLVGSAALNVGHDRDDGSVLQAVYSGGAVGAPDVEEIAVRLTIRDGMVSRVRYDVPVEGVTARVVTVISPGEAYQGSGQAARATQ